MATYTYILRCADGTFYAGSTIDLDTRLETHAQGLGSDYTSCRRPLELVWFAEFERIDEAFRLRSASRAGATRSGRPSSREASTRSRGGARASVPSTLPVVERAQRVETCCLAAGHFVSSLRSSLNAGLSLAERTQRDETSHALDASMNDRRLRRLEW